MRTITTPLLASALSSRRAFALIDVMSEDEHARGHIPRAINVPASTRNFTAEVTQRLPHKKLPVVLYSEGPNCNASRKAAERLNGAGFDVVYDYTGGMEAWREQGNPVASSVPSRKAMA